jgi:signal transduction histidine kinase
MLKKSGYFINKILILRHLPFLTMSIGILISILGCFVLLKMKIRPNILASLEIGAPWIVLISGILISCLLVAMMRFARMAQDNEESFKRMNADFKREMSERIHAQESKQELEKALLQGQKLQAIGTLAGGIAHDFNNILYAIIGYVELSREDVEKNSIVYQNLGKVLDASHRGQELISRILTFSRRHHHHEFKPIPVKMTMESVFALLKPTIPSSVAMNIHFMNDDIWVMGNQTQLHQIVVNIITNAVDAMEGEGTITLQLSRVTQDAPQLTQFPPKPNRNYCKIEISDTGHGMDQATAERIFEPFFTTKEVGKGTGLGLSTVHAIVEEHEGTISVTSQLGHGTTFTILLPEYSESKGA